MTYFYFLPHEGFPQLTLSEVPVTPVTVNSWDQHLQQEHQHKYHPVVPEKYFHIVIHLFAALWNVELYEIRKDKKKKAIWTYCHNYQ